MDITNRAKELTELLGPKDALKLCDIYLKNKDKSTERYDRWRKIKRYINANISTLPIPNP